MTPRRSLMGTFAAAPVVRSPWKRRAVAALLVIALFVLGLFPERYRAVVTLTPTDPASFGLSATLGQLGAINNVFGNQAAIEISLKVARSTFVRHAVIERLGLVKRMGFANEVAAQRWLDRHVEIRSLRGGIVQIEYLGRDPAFAEELVGAFLQATRERLAAIARGQTAYKREVLLQLVREASDRLAVAQSTYDNFRLRTRYSQPLAAIEAIGDRIPTIEAAIKAKEVQINAARQFATDDNMTVRQLLAERDALARQLAQAKATNPTQDNSVGRVVRQSTQADKLSRELFVAQSLYDGYKRFLEGTAVEDLTSTASVRVLEPPYIDSERQYNWAPLALALAILLLALAVEAYELRPPIERTREA